MAKSQYAEHFRGGNKLINQIRDEQLNRLRDAPEQHRHLTINDWIDLAKAENAVKERYQGRYLFELLQNANDAAIEELWQKYTDIKDIFQHAKPVRIQLTEKSLLIANHGVPFGADNVRSLCRLHKSTKSASKQIGHKGIGFKSVLEITDCPEIYSDCYSFKFTHDGFTGDVQKIMGKGWSSTEPLPILRAPYPVFLNQLPAEERACVEELLDDEFVTVVRLPLEEDHWESVQNRLRNDISPRLLLFMPAISQVEITFPDGSGYTYFRSVRTNDVSANLTQVILQRETCYADRKREPSEDSRWLVMGPIQREIEVNRRVELLNAFGEAWKEVTALRFSLAFPLKKQSMDVVLDGKTEPFHVYYPTQEPSGLRFIVNGDFYIGDDRKTLPVNDLNKWLIDEICLFLAGDGIELLKQKLNSPLSLAELLSPISKQERDFAQIFNQRYLDTLKDAPFVKTDGDFYKPPSQIKLPPEMAEHEKFYQLFPASRLRGKEKWWYPDPQLTENSKALSFLKADLGVQTIGISDLSAILAQEGMPPLAKALDLIGFLADWWYNADLIGKNQIIEEVKKLRILPTTTGWKRPTDSNLIFQANLRPNPAEIKTPAGFDYFTIIRSVYPPRDATTSPVYHFLEKLGAKGYEARSILQQAILPILTDEKKIKDLAESSLDSILQAYKILFDYYGNDDSSVKVTKLEDVFVPAGKGKNNDWKGWKRVSECYIGSNWSSAGQMLEFIYSDFEDCFFLDEIKGLELAVDSAERTQWVNFFCWLGALDSPKPIHVFDVDRNGLCSLVYAELWDSYLAKYREDFNCTNNSVAHHKQPTRKLKEAHSLHHFSDLAKDANPEKLRTFFELISTNWLQHYKQYINTRLVCNYEGCRQHSGKIEDFFLFELQNTDWLPIETTFAPLEILAPNKIWLFGETEPNAVRTLLPSLPQSLRDANHQEFIQNLGFVASSNAQIEDFVSLLQSLSKWFPMTKGNQPKEMVRGISSLFNWICERIQSGLINRQGEVPECPTELNLLAFRGDDPCYEPLDSPELFFADSAVLKQRWSHHCAFVRFNDDWVKLREWLGVPRLSEKVATEWVPGSDIAELTSKLKTRFGETLPFFLALVKENQPANYERIRGRLERLDLHVVGEILIAERLTTSLKSPTVTTNEKIHIKTSIESNSRGGTVMRGEIYSISEIVENYDLLGSLIADYIEITRLGDAFVLLMDREDKLRKRQFLMSKGISEELITEVYSDLGRPEDDFELAKSQLQSSSGVADLVNEKIESIAAANPMSGGNGKLSPVVAGGTPFGNGTNSSSGSGNGASNMNANRMSPPPSYPKLKIEKATGVHSITLDNITIFPKDESSHGRGYSSSSSTGTIPNQQVNMELGQRGEEWVYASEKQRLIQLGLDPEELEQNGELIWVSAQHPTSPYDIRSVDLDGANQLAPIFIEVKGTSGNGLGIHMSRQELEFALEHTEQYWLYYVADLSSDQPTAPIRLQNIGKLILERKLAFDLDSISLKLPAEVRESMRA